MTTKKTIKDNSAPVSPVVPTYTRVVVPQEQMEEIRREILEQISSLVVDSGPPQGLSYGDCDLEGNHFAWSATQINLDFSMAAQCEFEGDVYIEDEEYFDLYRSDSYRHLKATFLYDAMAKDSESLGKIVWRAYNAGRLSPERLEPSDSFERKERHRRYEVQKEAEKQRKAGESKQAA